VVSLAQPYDVQTLDTLVKRVLRVESFTLGDNKQYVVRYRGRLYSEDTEAAYDQLASLVKPYGLTPLFRWDGDQHVVLLIPELKKPLPSNPRLNLILFILTVLSVLFTGALTSLPEPPSGDLGQVILAYLKAGWPFALSVIAILGSHELGHYFAGRFHGVHVTLPYFIPLPVLSPLGTMGAVISMKEPPKNRNQLLDIGIMGPLAGLLVTLPVLYIGLHLSHLETLPTTFSSGEMLQLEGNSIVYLLMKFLVFGKLLPAPSTYGSISPILYWIRYFFTGTPIPLGGTDVMISPVAFAGWAGLLVTMMNLIPAGQLDGGHMLYVLFGQKKAVRVLPFILGALVLLSFFWLGWTIWIVLILLFGRFHAEPLDLITPLGGNRKVLALLALVLFVLIFVPIPFVVAPGPLSLLR